MFKWKNKTFAIFLMSQYQFQYQLPGHLVSTRIWIRPVKLYNDHHITNFVTIVLEQYIYSK